MSFKPTTQWMLVWKLYRTEQPMLWTVSTTRRGARHAFVIANISRADGEARLARGLKDGTIRYARVRLEDVTEPPK